MKKFIVSLSLFISVVTISFGQAIGEWRIHLAYNNMDYSLPTGNLIYGLSDGSSLFSYDTEDTSVFTYDKNNYLSDNEIAKIAYSKTHKALIIVYTNANIDLLINDKETYNISDFMKKTMSEDKTVNNIFVKDEYAYLSTNFGIVILNLNKKEITNTYNLGEKINDCIIYENAIFAASTSGVYKGELGKNLLDKNEWEKIANIPFIKFVIFDNQLLGNSQYADGFYKYENNKFNTSYSVVPGYILYTETYDNKLIITKRNSIIIFSDNLNNKAELENDEGIAHLSYYNNTYWGSNGIKGLNAYKFDTETNKLVKTVSSILPNSPRRNLFYNMNIVGNRLLVAGGSYENFRTNNKPGTIMMYEDGKWSYFQEEGIAEKNKFINYYDIVAVVQDPVDPETHYAASSQVGLFKFNKTEYEELYTLDNSPLETVLPDDDYPYQYVRMTGLVFDKNNNLWMANNEIDHILKVLKPDGNWFVFDHKEIAGSRDMEKIIFDQRGWVWVTSYYDPGGIFCLNTNNTLENTNDDESVFYGTFVNQDGKKISIESVMSIAEDKNGVIWLGTDKGPFVINNFNNLFNPDNFYFTQIKIPRNDGTNNADLLLEYEGIRAICVDGANRKWIGTQNSGIYLLSEDGLETIHHFTTENSPLISNYIETIVIDPSSGMVYIGTDKGLVTYKGDATEGENSFSEDAYAYPNPVYPDYDGVITVTGMVRDSDVKIVDSAGNLIYTSNSLGGQFTWDGKNRQGKRVASGVYFVVAANEEGKQGIITKILMIK